MLKKRLKKQKRHEENTYLEELKDQNVKTRYYGEKDPVAEKMLRLAREQPDRAPPPPEDQFITTLFLGGVTDDVEEKSIRFEKQKNKL